MTKKIMLCKKWSQDHSGTVDLLWALLVGFLLVIHSDSFFSCFLSPMQSWDSQIYYMIGEMWGSGAGIPYRDLFDHKGPLLYLINCCAYWCGGSQCLAILEFISFFLTVWILEKTFSFISVSAGRVAVLLFPLIYKLTIMITPYQSGNFPEQYALLFLSYGIFCTTKLHYTGALRQIEIFLLGISIGCCFLLKPNLIYLFPVPAFQLIFTNFRFRNGWFRHCLLIAGGIIAAILPFIIYFWFKGALYDYLYANILYNLEYAKRSGAISIPYRLYLMCGRMLWYKMNILPVLCLLVCILTAWWKKEKRELTYGLFLLAMFCLFSAAVFSHRAYHAYNAIVGIPLSLCGFALILRESHKNVSLIFFLILFGLWFDCPLFMDSRIQFIKEREYMACKYRFFPELKSALQRHKNHITIFAGEAYGYEFLHAKPSCRFFYLPYMTPALENELKQMIRDGKIPLVYIPGLADGLYKPFAECLEQNGYAKTVQNEAVLYEKQN